MAFLTWKHGITRDEAVAAIKSAIERSGYGSHAQWTGSTVQASYGPLGSIVHAVAEVTDEAVILKECSGIGSGSVVSQARSMLSTLFPGGREA